MANPNRVRAGKHSRTKGNSNERTLAKVFKDWWGFGEWARCPASGGWATPMHREAFKTCGDIITTATDFPFVVEAKKQEGWTIDQLIHNDKCIIFEWWKQCVDETPDGMIPLLVIARNHIPHAVMFSQEQMEVHCAKFHTDPGHMLLWSNYPCLVFEDHITKRFFVLLSLDNFFKIDPKHFGRADNVESIERAREAQVQRQAPTPGAENSKVS